VSHYLTLSHVSRLTGVPRARLQEMARAGEIATFDGAVELAEVLRVFPDIRIENDSEILRVEAIKDAAMSKSPEAALPEPGVLMGRLEALGREYAAAKVTAGHLADVLAWTQARLRDLQDAGIISAAAAADLAHFLRREAEMPADERARHEALIRHESRFRIMSALATLLPAGHQFEVEGRETLLEAALRAGHSLPYGCSNGACGECRVRIVSGQVVKVRPHDCQLSAKERQSGTALACAYAPVGDVVLEAGEAGADLPPRQDIVARVRMVERLGDGIIALHVVTPPSRRLRFLAGQKLAVTAGQAGAELPIASCPCEERRIELHIRNTDGALFEAAGGLTPGQDVRLSGPTGSFCLDETSRRPLLLAAQGAGYAQIKSLVQHALALEQAPAILVVRQTDSAGSYQDNLMRSYAASLDGFRYVNCDGGQDLAAAIGSIAGDGAEPADCDAYLVGNAEFLARAMQAASHLGLPAARIQTEVAG
jgi:CDP-4-dehydro-6-deoxyglucose reductase